MIPPGAFTTALQPTYDIKYFFGKFCKKRINDINWIPRLDGEIRSVNLRREVDEDDRIRRQALVGAGFPGDGNGGGFDREKWMNDMGEHDL